MKRTQPHTHEEVGRKHGFHSGLEDKIAAELSARGIVFEYETVTLHYLRPETWRRYTPDFLLPNGIIVETKGRFVTDDRQKMKWIKDQYSDLDIRFVFSNSKTLITKRSHTTYGMWAERNGFAYADKSIPHKWLIEAPCERRLALVATLKGKMRNARKR